MTLIEQIKDLINRVENARNFDGSEGKWVTIKGTHVFIPDGKSVEEVIEEKGWGSDKKNERIEARHKHQEVVKRHNQAYKDFEDGKITMEELEKADKELEKSNKEFYATPDTKDGKEEKKSKADNSLSDFEDTLYEALAEVIIENGLHIENADDIVEWITVKGNHIPIMKGQSKEEATQEFIDQLNAGGYQKKNGRYKSNRNVAAKLSGLDTKTGLAKKLGISSDDAESLYSKEWHHTGKDYKKEKFYCSDAYLDLKKNGEISKETIEKYTLNKNDVEIIKESWNRLQTKIGNKDKGISLIESIKEKYKDDGRLLGDLNQVLQKPNKNDNYVVEEIRRFLNAYKEGAEDVTKERVEEVIDFYSTKAREQRKNK